MDFVKAIILGIVEGITEFLPISSTGHLIILNNFLSFSPDFEKSFDIFIQFGAILSVVVYFWHRLNPFERSKNDTQKKETLNLWLKVIIAVIPAIVIGAIFGGKIQKYLFNSTTVALALIIGGVVMIIIELTKNDKFKFSSINEVDYLTCFLIGIFQCLSFIPGTSRAAATIIGAMILGLSRGIAVEFSFFLALPTMFAASAFSLIKIGFSITIWEWAILITGFITSFIVAYFIIGFFINFVRKHNFIPFAVYRIILGIIVLVYFWFKSFN